MSKKHRAPVDETSKVLFALGATNPTWSAPCPTDETMAAFIDNRLDEAQRSTFLQHLDACPRCYQQWLEVCAQKESSETVSPLQVTRHAARRLWYSGAGLAAAACLVVVLLRTVFIAPDMHVLLNKSYNDAIKLNLSSLSQNPPMLPWETENVRGTSIDTQPEPILAFESGFLLGRNQLIDNKATQDTAGARWTGTDFEVCYALGKWSYLIESACESKSGFTSELITAQPETIRMINEGLAGLSGENFYEIELVKASLSSIDIIFTDNMDDTKKLCNLLAPEIEIIKESLSHR